MKYFKVKYKKWNENYNLDLLIKNGKKDNLEKLKRVYIELFKTFEKMENIDNPVILYYLNEDITEIEYKLQELWGFTKDSNYHSYWFQCPKCTCPKMDNNDAIGTKYRYYDIDCIVHGKKTLKLVKIEKKIKRIIKK